LLKAVEVDPRWTCGERFCNTRLKGPHAIEINGPRVLRQGVYDIFAYFCEAIEKQHAIVSGQGGGNVRVYLRQPVKRKEYISRRQLLGVLDR
jgi:hypothetical protein